MSDDLNESGFPTKKPKESKIMNILASGDITQPGQRKVFIFLCVIILPISFYVMTLFLGEVADKFSRDFLSNSGSSSSRCRGTLVSCVDGCASAARRMIPIEGQTKALKDQKKCQDACFRNCPK